MGPVEDIPALADNDDEIAEPAVPATGSALDRIRQRRREIASQKTITLEVPRYEGDLLVRYRLLPQDEINAFMRLAAKRGPTAGIQANADLLIKCCDAVLVRQRPGAPLEPINPDDRDPTTFSSGGLAELLGESAASARETVFAVFSPGGGQPLAIMAHVDAVISFLQGKVADIDRELLGE